MRSEPRVSRRERERERAVVVGGGGVGAVVLVLEARATFWPPEEEVLFVLVFPPLVARGIVAAVVRRKFFDPENSFPLQSPRTLISTPTSTVALGNVTVFWQEEAIFFLRKW